MIKNVHKLEIALVEVLNLEGWQLEHTGEGFKSYDAVGKTPKGVEVVIEMKFRGKYYKEKMIEKFKYDKLMATKKVALYFVSDPKGSYIFHLNNLNDLKIKNMYCPSTTLWDNKKVMKPCYLLKEEDGIRMDLKF